MAWTAPVTWVEPSLVTAGLLNAQLRDNFLVLAVPYTLATGKIAAISAAYFTSLSGVAITGITLLAAANTYTAGIQSFNSGTCRLIIPVGADKWAV